MASEITIDDRKQYLVEEVLSLEELTNSDIVRIQELISGIDRLALRAYSRFEKPQVIKAFIHLVKTIKKLTDNPSTTRTKDDKFVLEKVPVYEVLSKDYKQKLVDILFNEKNNYTQTYSTNPTPAPTSAPATAKSQSGGSYNILKMMDTFTECE